MTDKPTEGRSRKFFWTGIVIGISLGAILFFLTGWILWNGPF